VDLSNLLEERQRELGYKLLFIDGCLEIRHGDRPVCSLPVTASARVIRGTSWQDSFFNHLLGRG